MVEKREITEGERAQVKAWVDRINAGVEHWKPAYDRMRVSQQLAAHGADEDWLKGENYTVPLITRFINLSVSHLYAKNPTTEYSRKERMIYEIWDGSPEAVLEAQNVVQQALANPEALVGLEDELSLAKALLEDVRTGKTYERMLDRLARTLRILWDYMLDEQDENYELRLKALVRRGKVNGVAYARVGFQRDKEIDPAFGPQLDDLRERIAHIEQLKHDVRKGDLSEGDAEYEELKSTLAAHEKEAYELREGVTLNFPQPTDVVFSTELEHLTTLAGTPWLAVRQGKMTRERILKVYKVDINDVSGSGQEGVHSEPRPDDFKTEEGRSEGKSTYTVWDVEDKVTRTIFTVAEGVDQYLRKPKPQIAGMDGFYSIVPITFNEIEHETERFPVPDPYKAKDMQQDFNGRRQSAKEHRQAARPKYVAMKGAIVEGDKGKLEGQKAHSIIELEAMLDTPDVNALIQRLPSAGVDPNLYETGSVQADMQMALGAQEANLGGVSGGSATESSIAEQSRMSGVSSEADDVDSFLARLARKGGGVLLMNMGKEQVVKIVGPGAMWPDAEQTRREFAKEIHLKVEAGSSGKPNEAQELANWERAMPYILQLPGINAAAVGRFYARLLKQDPSEFVKAGSPSISSVNAGVSRGIAPQGDAIANGMQGSMNTQQTSSQGPKADHPAPQQNLV